MSNVESAKGHAGGGAILTIVRHGETAANTDGVWHGSTDTPLNERGRAQAKRVAAYIAEHHADVSAIYCSPLERARDTAGAIGASLGREPAIRPDLAEYDLGAWEGETYADLHEKRRFWHHIKEDPDYAPHGGESPRQVVARVSGALRSLAAAHAEERIVVVTHGGALSMVLPALLEGSYTSWGRVMNNCAVSELVLEPEPSLLCFNETGHLDGI